MEAVATEGYNYRHFRLRHMLADLWFAPGGLEPGQQLPRLVLETVEGDALDLAHLDRPHLFVFGSNTCPMTASAGPTLERLQGEFGADIGFVLVQVREAHPGERLDQPTSINEKASLARRLHAALGVNMIAAYDDLDGSLHTAVDPKPNAAYLVACDGTILFRALWSSDERGLRSALAAVASGRAPATSESTRMVRPMVRSLGYIDEVLREAGSRARWDLARSALPMLIGGRLASTFRRLAPSRRGPALTATAGSLAIVLGVVVWWL